MEIPSRHWGTGVLETAAQVCTFWDPSLRRNQKHQVHRLSPRASGMKERGKCRVPGTPVPESKGAVRRLREAQA